MKELRQDAECKVCEHKHVVFDEVRGEVYCKECFTVLESNRIDYAGEYVDASENTSVTTRGTSKLVGKERKAANRLQYLEKAYFPSGHGFEIQIIYDQTLNMLDRNYEYFRNDVKWVYERLPSEYWAGKTRDVKIGSISYVLAKAKNVDLDPKVICKVCNCKEDLLQRDARKIADTLRSTPGYHDLMESENVLNDLWLYPKTAFDVQAELIRGYCSDRSLPETLAARAVENMEKMMSEVNPETRVGVGAAHLVDLARKNGVNISLNNVSKYFGNQNSTIRNRIKEINSILN